MKKYILLFLLSFWNLQIHAQATEGRLSRKNKKLFLGTWSLVAVENTNADGSKTTPYGENPKGLLVFCENGEYAIQILRAQRPLVTANDKNKATPEENAALVKGNNSHYGTYAIDTDQLSITFNILHAFYPNWEGKVQIRSYTLQNNLLRYVVTNTTNGGAVTAEVVWRKSDK